MENKKIDEIALNVIAWIIYLPFFLIYKLICLIIGGFKFLYEKISGIEIKKKPKVEKTIKYKEVKKIDKPIIDKKDKLVVTKEISKDLNSVKIPSNVYEYHYVNHKAKDYVRDYCVIDTETTGLEPELNRIIEISAIKYRDGKEVARFVKLINPERKLSSVITKITGITDRDLSGKPKINKILPEFIKFIGDDVLVAHNMNFDIKMIVCECYRCGIPAINNKLIDTIPIAKKLIPSSYIPNYKLETIKNFFNIKLDSHRADVDCEMCNYVYSNFVDGFSVEEVDGMILLVNGETGEVKDFN